jgi:hypothetical protein
VKLLCPDCLAENRATPLVPSPTRDGYECPRHRDAFLGNVELLHALAVRA